MGMADADGDPRVEDALGRAYLLRQREDAQALGERGVLVREQLGAPGQGANLRRGPCLGEVGDELERAIVVHARDLLPSADPVCVAGKRLRHGRVLDVACAEEKAGCLLELRRTPVPGPRERLAELEQQSRIVGIVLAARARVPCCRG